MPGNHTFFSGSTLLQPLADQLGIGLDQINFVMCQMISLPASLFLYHGLSPRKVSKTVRLMFHIVMGFSICFFCFGCAMKHLIFDAVINYAIMRWGPSQHIHRLVFVVAMGYLSWIHFYRAYLAPSYRVDITGPMMVLTQKLTSLAFSVHDGKLKTRELTDIQKRERVERVPDFLEFLSYAFAYEGILCGPACFYTDFISFVDGKRAVSVAKQPSINNNVDDQERYEYVEPTPWAAVLHKLTLSLSFAALNVICMPYFPKESFFDPNIGFLRRIGFVTVHLFLFRAQYYYAWVFSDVVYNAAGFGFNGFASDGRARWDLVSNVKIWECEVRRVSEVSGRKETSTSWKECLDSWNCFTLYWLRRVAYERMSPRYRTLGTYLVSAWWHGFFPGYYFTFVTGALFTITGRVVRLRARPYVLDSKGKKFGYDLLTFAVTKLAIMYGTVTFVLLHFGPSVRMYGLLYGFGHFSAIALLIGVPRLIPKK